MRALALCIDAQDAAVALAAMNAVARVAVDVPIKHNLGLLGCVPLLVSGSGLFPIIRTPYSDSSYPLLRFSVPLFRFFIPLFRFFIPCSDYYSVPIFRFFAPLIAIFPAAAGEGAD